MGDQVNLTLPAIAQVNQGEYEYTLINPDGDLPLGLVFNAAARTLTGTLEEDGTWVMHYVATSGDIEITSSFTISTPTLLEEILVESNIELSKNILSRHAIQTAETTNDAVKSRLELVGTKRNPYAESQAMNSVGVDRAANIQSKGINYSVWLANRNSEASNSGEFNWSSDISVSQVGFDITTTNNFFFGLISESVSSSTSYVNADVTRDYDISLDYVSLFGGYKNDKWAYWLSLTQGGSGSLTFVESANTNTTRSDLTYSAFSGGATLDLSDTWTAGIDYILDASLESSSGYTAAGSASSLKLYADWKFKTANDLTQSDAIGFAPKLSFGFRSDSGDAGSASGLDLSASTVIRIKQFFVELGLRSLSAGDFEDTAYWLNAQWQPSGYGFGLAFNHQAGLSDSRRAELFSMDAIDELNQTNQSSDLSSNNAEISYSTHFGNAQIAFYGQTNVLDSSVNSFGENSDWNRLGIRLNQNQNIRIALEKSFNADRPFTLTGEWKIH